MVEHGKGLMVRAAETNGQPSFEPGKTHGQSENYRLYFRSTLSGQQHPPRLTFFGAKSLNERRANYESREGV